MNADINRLFVIVNNEGQYAQERWVVENNRHEITWHDSLIEATTFFEPQPWFTEKIGVTVTLQTLTDAFKDHFRRNPK